MNCYAGLAKRLIKSCFPRNIPVPQLEPLDAKNIIKQDVTDISINKTCFALSDADERLFKPKHISDEEAWAVAIAWAEAKAKEREAKEHEAKEHEAKEETQTDTDESYDSDDSEFGVPTYPVKKSGLFANEDEDTVEQLVRSIIARWVTTSKKWYAASTIQAVVRGRLVRSGAHEFFNFTDFYNAYYLRKAAEARQCWWVTTYTLSRTAVAMATLWNVEKRAATIIQATARGRAVRAWNPFISASSASQTDTDEYYDSDDSDWTTQRPPLAAMAGLMRADGYARADEEPLDDAAAAAAMWRDDVQADAYECVAAKKALEALDKWLPSPRKYTAATIIQATERGRAVRAWKAQFIDGLAVKLEDAWRKEKARYLTHWKTKSPSQIVVEREQSDSIAFNTALFAPVRNTILGVSGPIPLRSAVWSASPKCVRAWIKLADWRRVVMFRV
jgi:hypothetical protein